MCGVDPEGGGGRFAESSASRLQTWQDMARQDKTQTLQSNAIIYTEVVTTGVVLSLFSPFSLSSSSSDSLATYL